MLRTPNFLYVEPGHIPDRFHKLAQSQIIFSSIGSAPNKALLTKIDAFYGLQQFCSFLRDVNHLNTLTWWILLRTTDFGHFPQLVPLFINPKIKQTYDHVPQMNSENMKIILKYHSLSCDT